VTEYRVLTVCTGNVCRSPAAAVMLRHGLAEAGLADRVEVGSAGTSWDVAGMPIDDRTALALTRAGYQEPFEHTARTIHFTELLRWDLVLPMTPQQAATIQRSIDQIPEGDHVPEVHMWREFDPEVPARAELSDLAVPDPWYEGQKAFDRTIRGMMRSVPSLTTYVGLQLAERSAG
jgi:protein-tyrosine phosphatase